MDFFRAEFPEGDELLRSLRTFAESGATLEVGTGFFKAGAQVPEHGQSVHPKREITLILEGELSAICGGETTRLGAGDIATIPAGEPHKTVVHKDTRLLWLFFGE